MDSKKKEVKVDKVKELVAMLNERFPKCFILEGEVKPFKVGILQEVLDICAQDEKYAACSKTIVRKALRYYTHRQEYLNSLKVGAERVDLEGNVTGTVETEHEEYAKGELEALEAYRQKKAKERQNQCRKPSFKKGAKRPFNKNGAKPGFRPRPQGAAQGASQDGEQHRGYSRPDGQQRTGGYKKYNNYNSNYNNNGERRYSRPSYDKSQGGNGQAAVVSQRRGFNGNSSVTSQKPFTPIPREELSVGMRVRVLMGVRNVGAVIKDLGKDVVSVELGGTGMIAKVSYDHVGR